MILTFAVMLLSGMGQPALLYLVPFTLITCAVVAACRGEMRQFWAGTTYEIKEKHLTSFPGQPREFAASFLQTSCRSGFSWFKGPM
ncbi:signal peptide peptidase-like 2A [Notothenia coriiceps]|uniref:Signal peptide peptidase-like 2A n=1 Tax=Notothenia coriiceps TaxID=8208 RepID=A0A6I9MV00_9TELE|nr:PREDICTED: signal peptide peptidase-like 2A [Notothenia coriiceps]